MGRFRIFKNSLLGGQISRDALGRNDIPQYGHSCELLQNIVPLLSGGGYRRPGTLFQDFIPADLSTAVPSGSLNVVASSPPRLFPFIVSNTEAYAILIGVNRNSANSAQDGAYMVYYRATGNKNGTFHGGVDNISYQCLPYRCKSVSAAADSTWEPLHTRQGGVGAVANSGFNGALSPVRVVDVVDSLQTYDDDVWSVQFCQANDVMFLTHPDYPPQVIYISTGAPIATTYDQGLTGIQLAQSRPYLNQNSTAMTMTISGVSGVPPSCVATLTASAPFFNPLHAPRVGIPQSGGGLGHGGAFFALAQAEGSPSPTGGIIFAEVISVTSSTVCVVNLTTGTPGAFSSSYTTTAWWESAWSNYRGWPRACGIFQGRLCFAGTIHQPNALWFTAVNSYGAPNSSLGTFCKFTALGDGASAGIVAGATGTLANGQNYTTPQNWVYYPVDDAQGDGQSTGPLGSQPFRISLATTTLDAIQYLSPDQQLFIGTATQEWICSSQNGSFDVANSDCTIQSHYGSDYIQAIRIGYELMFVLQNKTEVRAYQYNYYDQSFFGEPVQLFFDEYPGDEETVGTPPDLQIDFGRRKYRSIDWDASRSTLWCVDTAGNLFGLTRDRKLSITTWHTHQLGGFNPSHGVAQNFQTSLAGGNDYTDAAYYSCDGSVISACSVPNPLSGIRDLWVVAKRSVVNNTVWCVERMVGANTVRNSAYSTVAPGDVTEPYLVDCAYWLTDHDDPANFAYTVNKQLAGATLLGTYYSAAWGIFAIEMQGAVASNGAVSLQTNLPPDYGSALSPHTIVVGLPYSSIIQPVRPDMPSPIGTSQGAIKRPSKAYIRVFKTMQFKMGSPPADGFAAQLENVKFKPSTQMAQSPDIYTGDKEVFLPATFTREGYVYIVQDQPLPFTFVALSLEGMEYEQ